MSAILVPGVNHRLLSGKSRTALQPQIINVHTMVWDLNNCENYFAGKGRPYSHFGTGHDGEIRQWQDLRYRAASCLYGNPYNISIENADRGAGFPTWSGSDVPRFTDAQAESLVVLISWLCHRFGLPKSAVATSRPHERGVGYHRLGVNPYRHPDGRLWSSATGKACPGDRRIHQLIHEIMPAVSSPVPTTSREDILMAAALDDNDARKALIRIWFHDYLGRGPRSVEERDLHLWVFGTAGADACLAGITDSKEARDFRAKRGW